MKLKYRGVSYDYNPANVEVNEDSVVGQYRGAAVRFHHPAKAPSHHHLFGLLYRGIAYSH